MFTRSGWGAIVLSVVAFAIGRIFGIIEMFVLGVGIVAALIVAIVTVAGRPPRLAVRRLVDPSTVQAGDAARVDIQLANTGTRRTPVLQLWEPVGPTGGATMNLAPLRPRERSTAAYRLPTTTRGLVFVGPMRARRRDVLGLASRTFTLPGRSELLVMPNHTPVRFPVGGSAGRLGSHLRLRAHGQTGTEFHSLRAYVTGDDLRRISWKASARSHDLVVKETALEGVKRCTIVLDIDPVGGSATTNAAVSEAFEAAVSAAASLVTGAVVSGLATRMVAVDIDLRGHDVASLALRWLAAVQPGTRTHGLLPSLTSGEGMGLVVVVTPSGDSRCARMVRTSIGPDETLVIAATAQSGSGAGSGSRDRFSVDASSAEAFVQSWSQLTGALAHSTRLPEAYRVAR